MNVSRARIISIQAGKPDSDDRELTRLGNELNSPIIGESNPLSDTQPEAAALHGIVVAAVTAEEAFKNARLQFGRNTRAGVGNFQLGKPVVALQRNSDRAVGLIIFDRVIAEV